MLKKRVSFVRNKLVKHVYNGKNDGQLCLHCLDSQVTVLLYYSSCSMFQYLY